MDLPSPAPGKIPPAIKERAFLARPVDPELADAYFAQQRSFEGHRLRGMARQRNLGLVVGAVGAAIGLMATYAVAALAPLKTVEPAVFVVDKATGIVARNTDLAGSTITDIDAVNRYFAADYVAAREGYVWEELNTTAEKVALSSTYEEAARYQAALKAPGGPPALYGRRSMVRTVIKSTFLLSDPAHEAKEGIMQVRFDRGVLPIGDDTSAAWDPHRGCIAPKPTYVCQTWSAKFHFTRMTTGLPEAVRLKNPLGWVVTEYEARPEGQ